MKSKLLAAIVIALSFSAHAGKQEREKQGELQKQIDAATAEYKKACGCALKADVKWDTFKNADEMGQIGYMVDNIKDGAPKYCTDAASKKAICKMTAMEIKRDKEAKFTFAGNKGTLTTDGQMNVGWDQITAELDK